MGKFEDNNANILMDSPSSSFSRKYFHVKTEADLMGSLQTSLVKSFLSPNRRWLRFKKLTAKCKTLLASFLIATLVLYMQLSSGFIERCFLEIDFQSEFSRYPANLEDFSGTVRRYIDSINNSSFQPPPINLNYTKIPFFKNAPQVVSSASRVGLLIIVKSATRNYKKRKSIRRTWGNVGYLEKHFMKTKTESNLSTKVAFICGIPDDYDENCGTDLFPHEKEYGDIVLAQYRDNYGNNTFKTMLAMKWALTEVKSFKYLLIVDDDMYINPANAIEFIYNIPSTNARVVTSADSGERALYVNSVDGDEAMNGEMISLKDKPLLMGQLCVDAKPFRSTFGLGSKWSMAIEEYPYNYFPPYAAGGATLFDKSTVENIYYGSFFTQHFWIDDVFIGIIAHKLGIILTNTDLVDSSYRGGLGTRLRNKFSRMIAIHGLECPEQLVELWHSHNLESLTDCRYLTDLLL